MSGKRVEVVKGVDARITVILKESVSLDRFLKLVEEKLKERNIALFSIGKNRVVATWIDPEKAEVRDKPKAGSYAERLRLRREAVKGQERRLQSGSDLEDER